MNAPVYPKENVNETQLATTIVTMDRVCRPNRATQSDRATHPTAPAYPEENVSEHLSATTLRQLVGALHREMTTRNIITKTTMSHIKKIRERTTLNTIHMNTIMIHIKKIRNMIHMNMTVGRGNTEGYRAQ